MNEDTIGAKKAEIPSEIEHLRNAIEDLSVGVNQLCERLLPASCGPEAQPENEKPVEGNKTEYGSSIAECRRKVAMITTVIRSATRCLEL